VLPKQRMQLRRFRAKERWMVPKLRSRRS
jgi:hypothetical protein